ncbi:hypothetical protein [Methanobrevibacter smithii]
MELTDEMLTEISYVEISSYRKKSHEVFRWRGIDSYSNCKKFRD